MYNPYNPVIDTQSSKIIINNNKNNTICFDLLLEQKTNKQ